MGDTRIQNGFGDAALASKVISEYADGLERLSSEECEALEIGTKQCEALQQALGKGKEGIVTDYERADLERSGFSEDFIQRLAGENGKRALHERVKWLGDHCTTKWWGVDASASNRKAMLAEVAAIGPDAAPAVPALIEALKDENRYMREYAVVALGNIGAPAVPALIEALKDSDGNVRWGAAGALSNIGAPAVPALIKALEGEDRDVRWKAAQALGEIGPAAKHAIPTLERVRDNDPDPDCREAAKEAIERIAGD